MTVDQENLALLVSEDNGMDVYVRGKGVRLIIENQRYGGRVWDRLGFSFNKNTGKITFFPKSIMDKCDADLKSEKELEYGCLEFAVESKKKHDRCLGILGVYSGGILGREVSDPAKQVLLNTARQYNATLGSNDEVKVLSLKDFCNINAIL